MNGQEEIEVCEYKYEWPFRGERLPVVKLRSRPMADDPAPCVDGGGAVVLRGELEPLKAETQMKSLLLLGSACL